MQSLQIQWNVANYVYLKGRMNDTVVAAGPTIALSPGASSYLLSAVARKI